MTLTQSRYAISITPDLALDEGYTYAGGLGVLEGDKFYAAGKLGLKYIAMTFFYKYGYVDYDFDESDNPIPRPQQQPEEFVRKLSTEDSFKVRLRGEDVSIETLVYRYETARAIFFNVLSPEWIAKSTERIYIENNIEEKAYKYILLAKVVTEYIKRNMRLDEIAYIDLQEAYTALLTLQLKIPGKYRLVIHTAGIWGHPSLPRDVLEREYGYKFIERDILLTEVGLGSAQQALAVSAKHYDVLLKIFPHFNDRIVYVTNGVNIERWMCPGIRKAYESLKLTIDRLIEVKASSCDNFEQFIRNYKDISTEGKFIVLWARRITEYKRPWMVARLAKDLKDKNILFVIGGKAHPHDPNGIEYMKLFRKMHKEMPNVVFIHDYDVAKARVLLSSCHLLLFTPFSSLESCGTSYMKAAINAVPSLAVRDGGVLEFIVDGVNGWLFGNDIREPIDISSPMAQKINEEEYQELKNKLLKIYQIFKDEPETFYGIALSALRSFIPRTSMFRVLREYYPDLIKIPFV